MTDVPLEYSLSIEVSADTRGIWLAMIHLVEVSTGNLWSMPVADADLGHLMVVLPAKVGSLVSKAMRDQPPHID